MSNDSQNIDRENKRTGAVRASRKIKLPESHNVFLVSGICGPIIIGLFLFGAPYGSLEMERPEVVDIFPPERDNANSDEFNEGDDEYQLQVPGGDNIGLVGRNQGEDSKKHGWRFWNSCYRTNLRRYKVIERKCARLQLSTTQVSGEGYGKVRKDPSIARFDSWACGLHGRHAEWDVSFTLSWSLPWKPVR